MEDRGGDLAAIDLLRAQRLVSYLLNLGSMVRWEEPLQARTSFRIGGPAKIYIQPRETTELRAIVQICHQEEIPVYILGKGTNLLVSDRGIEGVVIHLKEGFDQLKVLEEGSQLVRLEVGSSLSISQLLYRSIREGWSGLEFAAGIPGSLGGAIIMNAGIPDRTIGDLIDEVRLMDRRGEIYTLSRADLQFTYRGSNIPAGHIILGAKITLGRRESGLIQQEVERYHQKRRATQPLYHYSAGCIFKNPPGDSAGRLIDSLGLKGLSVGDAQISHIHANFIINKGSATATQVITLMERIKALVAYSYGINLEPEIDIWGYD